MLRNNLVYKYIFQEINQILNWVFIFSMTSSLSDFSIGAVFGGIEPILGSLSPVV